MADVSFKEATIFTAASPNTIAMLLYHISFWNRVTTQRAQGILPKINDEINGFDAPQINSEADWNALKEDNLLSAKEPAEAIRNFDENKLELPILPGTFNSV